MSRIAVCVKMSHFLFFYLPSRLKIGIVAYGWQIMDGKVGWQIKISSGSKNKTTVRNNEANNEAYIIAFRGFLRMPPPPHPLAN